MPGIIEKAKDTLGQHGTKKHDTVHPSTTAGTEEILNKPDPRSDSGLEHPCNSRACSAVGVHNRAENQGLLAAVSPGISTRVAQHTPIAHERPFLNKLDPRVNLDHDHSATHGAHKTYK
ncbi:hypothetical protein RBB50_003772 [Rhinocladiella similis]